jgi:low temperature requirement protein LtrA
MSEHQVAREHRVRPLELFFDLVFVFGFTQVTTLFGHDPTWGGLGRGLLVLAVLWWAWASYAWLTNTVDTDAGPISAAMLVAIAAMFLAALAVPQAFDGTGLVFGIAFFIVSLMHVSLFALASRGDPDLLAAILRNASRLAVGAALIVVAAFVPSGVRPVFWLAALAVGFFGPLLTGVRGWRVNPAHFAERHGLIIIIAIGESFIAIGLGARTSDLSAGVIAAALLGVVIAASFWLSYFDFFSIRAEQMLAERTGDLRTTLARDIYTYLHLPMVMGIVLFALAMKTTLAHVGDSLDTISAVGLCGGSALYLFVFVALRIRVSRSVGSGRLIAAVACTLLLPVAVEVPALAAVALVAGVWVALHAYEIIWWREDRAQTRALRAES